MEREPRFGACDESGPNEAFEVLVGGRDKGELVDEAVCDLFVVVWEMAARRLDTWGLGTGPREDSACVEVDGGFVDVG